MAALEITHPDELAGLSTLPLRSHRGAGPIEIADETVDQKTRSRWETELNRRYYACGCAEGTIGLLLGLVVFGVLLAVSVPGLGAAIGLGVVCVLAGSALGKIVGLARANSELKRLTAMIAREWDAPKRVEEEPLGCG
jgi:hypothetical protein